MKPIKEMDLTELQAHAEQLTSDLNTANTDLKTANDKVDTLTEEAVEKDILIEQLNSTIDSNASFLKENGIPPEVEVGEKRYKCVLKGESVYKKEKITAEKICANPDLAAELVSKKVEYMVEVK